MKSRIHILSRFVILIGLVFLSAACAKHRAGTEHGAFFDEWKAKAEHARAHSPARDEAPGERPPRGPDGNPEQAAAAGTAGAIDIPGRLAEIPQDPKLPKARITLKMYHTDIGVLLRALARSVDQSIMISENVKGIANINTLDQPWDKVFLGILKTYGLDYDWIGDIIRIKTRADIDHEWEMEKTVLLQKELRWKFRNVEEFHTRIFFIDYASTCDLQEILSKMFTGTQKSQSSESGDSVVERNMPVVAVDDHNNAIIIHATEQDIENAARLIQALDKPTPQILIEAQIVEANRETARELGVQWGGLVSTQGGGLNQYVTSGWGTNTALGQPLQDSITGNAVPITPIPGVMSNFPADLDNGTGLAIGWVGERLGENVLSIQLSALQQEGKLNILSSPSITTLDNQKATIESGRDVPFQTVEDDEVKIIFKKAVLMLEVTPHVIDRKLLKLSIVTHKDELDFSNPVAGNPTIITKNAQTNIILFDGQTTVIGGLSKETTNDAESGIPFLKDLPLLGGLFRSQGKNSNLEEILIFITPHILEKKVAGPDPVRPEDAAG